MIVLKAHNRCVSAYSDIDKLTLVPKKNWDDFRPGENNYKINGKMLKLRVYDVPCDCNQRMHSHRIVDLREVWDEFGLSEGKKMEFER